MYHEHMYMLHTYIHMSNYHCTFVCIFIYICISCTMFILYVLMLVCTYVCIYVHPYACVFVRPLETRIHAYVICTYANTWVHVDIHMYIYVCDCVGVRMLMLGFKSLETVSECKCSFSCEYVCIYVLLYEQVCGGVWIVTHNYICELVWLLC